MRAADDIPSSPLHRSCSPSVKVKASEVWLVGLAGDSGAGTGGPGGGSSRFCSPRKAAMPKAGWPLGCMLAQRGGYLCLATSPLSGIHHTP